MRGVGLIAAERLRQVEQEGWTPEHDDSHVRGELATVAAELVVDGTGAEVVSPDGDWDPWNLVVHHREDRIRQLVIAGALIAAEIDRLQRKAEAMKGGAE